MVIKIGKMVGSSRMPGVDPNDYKAFYECDVCKHVFEVKGVLKTKGDPIEKPCPLCGENAKHWAAHNDCVDAKLKRQVN